MEFDKTKWSCPWNSDQNCTQNSATGLWGQGGRGVRVGVAGDRGVVSGGCQGVVGIRGNEGQGSRGENLDVVEFGV